MKGNTVSIKGNITRDAELRSTSNGSVLATWCIAWNASRKNQRTGAWEDVPHFFDVKCWLTQGQLKVVERSLVKGASCSIVDGHIAYESWKDQDEKTRSKVVVMVDDPVSGMTLVPPKGQGAFHEPPCVRQEAADAVVAPQGLYDEDIPF